MSTNKTLKMVKASNDLDESQKEFVEGLSRVLSSAGLSTSMLSDLSATEVVNVPEYFFDVYYQDDRVLRTYPAGKFAGKFSAYKNLSISGSYDNHKILSFRVIAETTKKVLFFEIPVERRSDLLGHLDQADEFIEKYGILA